MKWKEFLRPTKEKLVLSVVFLVVEVVLFMYGGGFIFGGHFEGYSLANILLIPLIPILLILYGLAAINQQLAEYVLVLLLFLYPYLISCLVKKKNL